MPNRSAFAAAEREMEMAEKIRGVGEIETRRKPPTADHRRDWRREVYEDRRDFLRRTGSPFFF